MRSVKNRLETDQAGMVSIVVTMMVMLVITLVVISFARVSRREQRQALDRQLNTQAFYAAETGVNDAIKALQTDPGIEKKTCANTVEGGGTYGPSQTASLDDPKGIGYTCVLIDPYPDSLQFDNIGTDGSKVIPLQGKNGENITSVKISWQAKDGTNDSSNTNASIGCANDTNVTPLVASASWPSGCAGVLRADFIPLDATFARNNLVDNVMTSYLLPKRSVGVAPPTCPNPNYASELAAYNAWNSQNALWLEWIGYPANQRLIRWSIFHPFQSPPTDPGPAPTTPSATITSCPPVGGPPSFINYDNSGNAATDNTGFPYQGQIITASCRTATATPYQCNMEIKIPSPGKAQVMLRLRSIYRASVVNISATKSDGTKLNLKGAQAIVDVTGKASDVLRRINVRVPTSTLGNGTFPDYAVLSADSLCKRFGVAPGLDPTYDSLANANPECKVTP